jgi:hypothetical protein
MREAVNPVIEEFRDQYDGEDRWPKRHVRERAFASRQQPGDYEGDDNRAEWPNHRANEDADAVYEPIVAAVDSPVATGHDFRDENDAGYGKHPTSKIAH